MRADNKTTKAKNIEKTPWTTWRFPEVKGAKKHQGIKGKQYFTTAQ